MRRCLRTNRWEAVSLDSTVVRRQGQAMARPDDYRFALQRPAVTSHGRLAAFVANSAVNRFSYIYHGMSTMD